MRICRAIKRARKLCNGVRQLATWALLTAEDLVLLAIVITARKIAVREDEPPEK